MTAGTMLTDTQRATLAGLADALIPAANGKPAASEIGVEGKWIDKAIEARPELGPELVRVLDTAEGRDPGEEARRLHVDDSPGFRAMATLVQGAYLMHPKARKRIGYPGQGNRAPFPDEADYDLRDDILVSVIERGETFLRPDSTPASNGAGALNGAPTAFQLPLPRSERPDVLIVGTGAGGGVAARHLAEAGFSIVCLEQGQWEDPSKFPGDKPDWELVADGRWSPDPNVRNHPADYPIGVTDSPITPVMFNAVGGSTIHFCAQWVRLRPGDLRRRSLSGVADDWPISYEELKPFYERIDREMLISGMTGDPAYPKGPPPPLPPLPIGAVGRTAALGMNKLGWHWWPAAHAIRSQAVDNLAACERTGACMWGCPKGAKSSTDITMIPHAQKHGARVITGARVREITVDERGLATGAIYVDRDGREQRQEASVVILAANGVGTPRLLQLSTSGRFPDGLANSSGLVGKRLMLHPYMSVLGIYDEPLESWLGPWGTQLLSLQFADHDDSRGFPLGAQWDVMPPGGPLFHLYRFDDRPFDERYGPGFHPLLERVFGRAFDWGVGIEDLPHEHNAVTLDPDLTDADGIPAPKITFEIDDGMRANLRFQLDRAREAHEAAGAVETIECDWSAWGWHLLGTARMGDDPTSSVVDRWCQAHDVPNLFVVDGSVFPTSGPMAPTSTICANSARVVARLIERAGLQPTPA